MTLTVLLKVTRFSGSIIACLLQQIRHDIITHATAFIYNEYVQMKLNSTQLSLYTRIIYKFRAAAFMFTPRLSYGARMPKCRWNPPTDTACRQMETAPI